MKRIIITIVTIFLAISVFGQEEDAEKRGFKKDHLFTGGSLTLSFGNNATVLGANPVLGYSITNWLDAGIALNFVYQGTRHVTYYNPSSGAYFFSDDKLRQFTYGPGAFVKVYPIKFLFLQAQAEYNFISQKLIFDNGAPSEKEKTNATSFLVGGGYASGRESYRDVFYYISILFDINKEPESPYVETTGSGKINPLPIIRAGLQVPLSREEEEKIKDGRSFLQVH